MKKIYKFMVFILMAALAIGSVIITPIKLLAINLQGRPGATFALRKMPKKGNVGEVVKLPQAESVTTDSNVTVKVTDPYGKNVETTENGNYLEFTPTVAGKYKVVYTASAVGDTIAETTSEVYTIIVKGSKVTLSLDSTNTPFIKQSRIGTNSKMVLPYPSIVTTDADGEKITTQGTKSKIIVEVKAPNLNSKWTENTDDADFTNPLSVVTIDGNDYYVFTPSKKVENSETICGYYEIFYTNVDTNTTISEQIQVSETYSVESQDVDFTWEGSLPESAVLGKSVDLPKPVTVDKNAGKASVRTYTKVEVQFVDGEETTNYEVEDFKFVPMDKAANGTYYKLTYKIYTLEQLDLANYFENHPEADLEDALEAAEAKALIKTYSLSNVTDTEAPVATAVFYDEVDEDVIVEEDASYAIPSKAQTSEKFDVDYTNPIVIPAIYATDNYSKLADMTLSRTLVDPDGSEYAIDGDGILNDDETTKPMIEQAATNRNATVNLKKEGTYKLRYTATDAAGKSSTTEYLIYVVDLGDDIKPSVVLPSMVESIDVGETITFNFDAKNDVKDYKNGKDGALVDTNIKVDVYYYYGNPTNASDIEEIYNEDLGRADDEKVLTKIQPKEGTTTYQVKVTEEQPAITIFVRAQDDGAYLGQLNNNVAYVYKTIKINQVSDDYIPEIRTDLEDVANAMGGAYKQNVPATIPAITVADSDNYGYAPKSLTTSIRVYDANNNEIIVPNFEYIYNNDEVTLENGTFYTTTAGRYSVVITVTDLANNIRVSSFEFDVLDSTSPVIYVENFDRQLTLGKKYTIPAARVTDDSELKTNEIVFTSAAGRYTFNQGTREFIAYEAGNYTFYYYAVDAGDNDRKSASITLSVSATESPEFELDETNGYRIEETLPQQGEVNIPLAKAEYADDIDIEVGEVEVTVKGPNNTTVEVEKQDDHYTFNANRNGRYTVTYKVEDALGKTFEKSYTIAVGDLEAPTLKGTVIPGSFKIGDSLEINLSDITVKDNVDGETEGQIAYNSKLFISVIGPDGTENDLTPTENVIKYEFTEAGDYTLKYRFTDEAENEDTALYSFKVEAAEDSSKVSEIAWGTVLIVAAVALVAGVVVYFIKTRDKSADKDKKETKEEK